MNQIAENISNRLSLRKPQRESLNILAEVLEGIDLSKDPDLKKALEAIQEVHSSVAGAMKVEGFERDFPSICFALATGVGKTRLMGAFISYLYLTGRSRHFLVLAPNLTIYEKLKEDFNPHPKGPKYVFRGIHEFVANPPVIITGEDYDTGKGVRSDPNHFRGQKQLFDHGDTPFINIFNISKLNAVENVKEGAEKSKTPRIRRIQETIGESYFDHLSSLDDLVVLMDEAHHYRATAGASAINELKPVLGLELTATPKLSGSKPVLFKNTIYAYSLAEALKDGYVKRPAVATRENFVAGNYSRDELEALKLEDGIWNHEDAKRALGDYAQQYGGKRVKPFVLVVAQDTTHARNLREIMESEDFFEGVYKGKIAEVHSKQSGTEEDENIQKLISVENPDESTEIVIHVDKLKEGWDVTNLYTIIPLRAFAADILTEQTIGRGLRLPYGRRIGVEAVDRLTIIAHERFQEIVDLANQHDSIIRQKIDVIKIGEGGDVLDKKPDTIVVHPWAFSPLASASAPGSDEKTIIQKPEDQVVADATYEAIKNYESLDNSGELEDPDVKDGIIKEVEGKIGDSADYDAAAVKAKINEIIENFPKSIIDIPQISMHPVGNASYQFNDFDLKDLETIDCKPVSMAILLKDLSSNNKSLLLPGGEGYKKQKDPKDYLILGLREHPMVDYAEHSELLHKLADQVVSHIKSYLTEDAESESAIVHNQKQLVDFIVKQLKQNCSQEPVKYMPYVKAGFLTPKPFNCTLGSGESPVDFRPIPENKSDVKKMLFTGFKKCCYPFQKFDSVEGELRFSHILEDSDDVIRWMKPAPGFFQIEYEGGNKYEPDFVVETETSRYICEVKMASDMDDSTVKAKSEAAARWCQYATDHANKIGNKPWSHALIPDSDIKEYRSFEWLVDKHSVSAPLV